MAAEAKKKRLPASTIHDSPLWKSSHKESKFHHRGRHVSDEASFHSLPTQPHSVSRRKSDDVISHPSPLRNESSLSYLHMPRKISMDLGMDPEELLNSGVKSVLRTYTEIWEKPNVQEINERVTWIYDTVEKAVVSMLKAVTMQQGDSASECIEYTVIPPSIVATFKGSDEDKNLPASCSSTPTVSPTPCSSSSNRPDSVETNTSGLQSATSQQSSHSSDSVTTNTSASQSASNDHTSQYCREDFDNENTSSTITDNTSLVAQPHEGAPESVTEVRCAATYIAI